MVYVLKMYMYSSKGICMHYSDSDHMTNLSSIASLLLFYILQSVMSVPDNDEGVTAPSLQISGTFYFCR
jgi:hypothetical protein